MDRLEPLRDVMRAARYRQQAREAEALSAAARLPEAREAYAELATWWVEQERRSWAQPARTQPRYSS